MTVLCRDPGLPQVDQPDEPQLTQEWYAYLGYSHRCCLFPNRHHLVEDSPPLLGRFDDYWGSLWMAADGGIQQAVRRMKKNEKEREYRNIKRRRS